MNICIVKKFEYRKIEIRFLKIYPTTFDFHFFSNIFKDEEKLDSYPFVRELA